MALDGQDPLTIDPATLLAVVRQAQQSPTYELLDWSIERLSDKGIINPDGLLLLRGNGYDVAGSRPWSVVLKILQRPDNEQGANDLWYWKRELLAMQSGLLTSLPGPVAVPRCYGVTEHANEGWIWMEHIQDGSSQHWTMTEYAFAAREIGRFNGAELARGAIRDFPWLCRDHARQWSRDFPPEQAWENPYVARGFGPHLRSRALQLWADRERYFVVLERLPQVFSHFDSQRRNLLIRQWPDGRGEVVALDWAFCGQGALGAEAAPLVGSTCLVSEFDPAGVGELDAVVFPAYVEGLHDAGWDGPAELVRLGYAAWFAMFFGAPIPALAAFWMMDERIAPARQAFGREPDELMEGWASLCEFALDLGEEARHLMKRWVEAGRPPAGSD